MAKNILIFADGTGQAGGLRPDQRLSNVYKLYRAARNGPDSPIDPALQVAFYDPGLGTATDAGLVKLRFFDGLKALAGSIAGIGISTNVVDCYEAILKHYEVGDRIYLFGFSRGAYTARNVAGVLNLCGVPTNDGSGAPLPRFGKALRAIAEEAVQKVYDHGAGKPRCDYESEREEQAKRFRTKYGSGVERGDVHPYLIGLFDAVAALGLPLVPRILLSLALIAGVLAMAAAVSAVVHAVGGWDFLRTLLTIVGVVALVFGYKYVRSTFKYLRDFPNKGNFTFHFARWRGENYDAFLDSRINVVRHALAVDETRRDFARVIWGSTNSHPKKVDGELEWFQQYWFAGNHSDIGGSYPEDESRLSDIALNWMVGEATDALHPIVVNESQLHLFPDAGGVQHCEVLAVLDMFPRWWPLHLRKTWPTKTRPIKSNATLHPSILRRFEIPQVLQCGIRKPYRPEALRNHEDVAHFYDGAEDTL